MGERNLVVVVPAWEGEWCMRKSEEYRLNAVNCLSVAEGLTDPAKKSALLAQARSWFALAEQAERNSKTDVVYETPTAQQPPVIQQQQQIQPVKEKKD